jgi:hypothetical protein
MAHLLGASKTFTPAVILMAAMLTLGVIPAQGNSVSHGSVDVKVAHYESSASGGVLRS